MAKLTAHPERYPVWLSTDEIDYLIKLIGSYDPHKLCKQMAYAKQLLGDNASRIKELAARMRCGTAYEETEEEQKRLQERRKERRSQTKSERFMERAQGLSLEQLEAMLAKLGK